MTRIAFVLALSLVPLISVKSSEAKPLPPAGAQAKVVGAKVAGPNVANQLPAKKKVKPKTTRIDFAESDGVVIAPRNSALNKAINKADSQQRLQEVEIRTRTFVPAPPGDQSEIGPVAAPKTPVLPPPILLNVEVQPPVATTVKTVVEAPIEAPVVAPVVAPVAAPIAAPIAAPVATSADAPTQTAVPARIAESAPARSHTAPPPFKQNTLAFFRTGYLHAHYKEFDSRMKDGATSIGLGAARAFQTDWGEFEARASMDVYHAMDQSVTVDNVRMFATRTEVAYWITKARVRPALTLGLGWADYAVKSYRSVKTDAGGEVVTLRTHAKSQAFTVIPGTALRIQLNDEIVIDTQTEFLGLLGGDSANAVQGLAFGLSFGWIF